MTLHETPASRLPPSYPALRTHAAVRVIFGMRHLCIHRCEAFPVPRLAVQIRL